jgi:PncC family amidohydrolase
MDTPPTSYADLADLAARLQAACLARDLTVAAAESCTGGLVAHAITTIPGSSAYFLGAVVSYNDAVKTGLLDVPADVLRTHGAVSAQVALAMAAGARSRVGAHLGVGITGVAGPDGGSDEKPVGLVYVAVADADGADVRRYLWTRDRAGNIVESAAAALGALLERAERAAEVASR